MADFFSKNADDSAGSGDMGEEMGGGMSCPECGCKLRVDRAEEAGETEEAPAAAPKKYKGGSGSMAEDMFGG